MEPSGRFIGHFRLHHEVALFLLSYENLVLQSRSLRYEHVFGGLKDGRRVTFVGFESIVD